jgi:hypothetical protein
MVTAAGQGSLPCLRQWQLAFLGLSVGEATPSSLRKQSGRQWPVGARACHCLAPVC